MTDKALIYLARLRRFLTTVVVASLVLSHVLLVYFYGTRHRERICDLVAFLHVFLPLWGWGYYAFTKRRLLGPSPRRFCDHCGYDLEGCPQGDCPECGEPTARRHR